MDMMLLGLSSPCRRETSTSTSRPTPVCWLISEVLLSSPLSLPTLTWFGQPGACWFRLSPWSFPFQNTFTSLRSAPTLSLLLSGPLTGTKDLPFLAKIFLCCTEVVAFSFSKAISFYLDAGGWRGVGAKTTNSRCWARWPNLGCCSALRQML